MLSLSQSLFRCMFLGTLLSLPGTSFGTDWLEWRGPGRTGTTPETDWNPKAILKESAVLWTKEVGMGHSSVTVQGGRLFTMGNRCIKKDAYEDIVWCLDAASGRVLWETTYPCPEGEDPGPGATPVLEGDRLYTLSREGHLHCLRADNGSVVWKRHLVGENLAPVKSWWGFSGSPLIHDRYLVLAANQAGTALDKETGDLLWATPPGEAGYGSPVLYSHAGRSQILLKQASHLRAVNLATGKESWRYCQGWGDADAVALGDRILITGQHTALVDVSGDAPRTVWKNDAIQWQFRSASLHENHAYGFGHTDGRTQPFYCFDIRTGDLKWTEYFEIYGSSIIAGGRLVILTGQGTLLIAETSPEGYRELARRKIITMQKNDNSRGYRRQCHCWTNPVLANGRIYARNSFGTLVCVDVRE